MIEQILHRHGDYIMDIKYAKRMSKLKASEIREILKVTEKPEMISFAGGLPAPELFPVKEIIDVNRIVLEESAESALQYSTTEGFAPLRQWIADRMNATQGTAFDRDHILITHGSQQSLDLSGKVFLDEGDVVLCESPTYLAAITAFRAYGVEFISVPTDDDGMKIEELERILENKRNVKAIYVIPNFQNPTGRTWSFKRRRMLAQVSSRLETVVIEDNPYGELRYEGEFLPSVKSFDTTGNVLITGTFSKIFCPGYRIGWIAGDKDIIRKYVLVKQGADLQCNTLAQMEIAKYLAMYDIDAHIQRIRAVYKARRDLMVKMMETELPDSATFTRPQGGLFAWVELPPEINAREVLEKCLKQNVAFVPGGSFFPNGGMENTLRLNFSNMPEDRIVEGMRRLGRVLRTFLSES
jgi:2-aminoadipate transaminase